MITDLFLRLINWILGLFVAWLPTAVLGSSVSNSISTIAYYYNSADVIMPVTPILLALATFIVVISLALGWRLVRFGISLIPFIG